MNSLRYQDYPDNCQMLIPWGFREKSAPLELVRRKVSIQPRDPWPLLGGEIEGVNNPSEQLVLYVELSSGEKVTIWASKPQNGDGNLWYLSREGREDLALCLVAIPDLQFVGP